MYYIGIDVGGMSIKAGVTDKDGNVLHKTVLVTKGEYSAEYTISNDIHALIVKLLSEANIPESEIAAIGIGQAGSIDSERGIINYWNNIPMKNVHVVEELHKWHSCPVFIDNDANVAALGECVFGAAKGIRNMLLITLGTGVGSGIIIDGKIYRGEYGAGAEAGHMGIVMDGEPCTCGRRGCFERYASATALTRRTKYAMEEDAGSAMWSKYTSDTCTGKTAFEFTEQLTPLVTRMDRADLFKDLGLSQFANLVTAQSFAARNPNDQRNAKELWDSMIDRIEENWSEWAA